jgi:vancomycin resistance protein YoaR
MIVQEKINETLSNSGLKNIDPKRFRTFLIIFYVLLAVIIGYHSFYAKKIIPGVRVAGENVGGMNFSNAKKLLEQRDLEIEKELKLKFEDKEFFIKDSEIGLEYDWENSVVKAFEIGRSGNFLLDTKNKIAGLFNGTSVSPSYDFDNDSLGIKLSIMKGDINVEALESDIKIVEDIEEGLEITNSDKGRKISDKDLYDKIIFSFENLDFSEKEIPIEIIEPEIVEKDLENFIGLVKGIISEDVTLNFNEDKWVLESEDILNLIEFKKDGDRVNAVLDDFEFDELSDQLAIEINDFPRGEVVSVDGKKVTEFRITQEGKELDVKKLKNDLISSIFDNRKPVSLSVSTVTDSVNKDKYGIVELIGEGTSHYAHSIPSRIHNLTLAAEKTSGVLVPPGGVYSMNDSVGPIDYQHGFQSAYIIKGGRTVLGEGGGVCQTSTTLFRAVLNSGLPILARYPHAYRVGYYEQDMPVGFDAAVFQPSWDFKFKNDTNAYVLVQASANLEENSLTFKLYGTSDGRKVEITEPVITGQIPPPEPLYEDDPELPKGVVRQVDYPAWGATSSFTRTVKRNGDVLFTDTYTSKYQPWRAIYKVGTKE